MDITVSKIFKSHLSYRRVYITILAWAAVTKYPRLGDLNNIYFSQLEDGKSEIRLPAWLGTGEGPLPGL